MLECLLEQRGPARRKETEVKAPLLSLMLSLAEQFMGKVKN
jgi:hypothetical protein